MLQEGLDSRGHLRSVVAFEIFHGPGEAIMGGTMSGYRIFLLQGGAGQYEPVGQARRVQQVE
jgi:hypothetical protein